MVAGGGTLPVSGRRSSREKPGERDAGDPRSIYYDTPQDKIRALEQFITKVEASLRKAEERADRAEAHAGGASNERLAELEVSLESAKKTGDMKQEKLSRLHRGVVDIYLEVRAKELGAATGSEEDGISMQVSPKKESAFEKPAPGEGLDKEQIGLLAKDPFTVLEFLRASLRILLSDRRRYEAELEKTIERRDANFLERQRGLQRDLDQANTRMEEELAENRRLQRRLAEAERQRQEVLDSGVDALAELREENSQLQEKLRIAEEETAMLNNWNSENMRHIQVQDDKLQKIPMMEAQLNTMATKNKAEQQKIVRSQKKKMQSLEKELGRSLKLEADNSRLEEMVQILQRENIALRKARNEPQLERLELKSKRMEEAGLRKSKEIDKLQDAVKKLTLKLEKKEEDLVQMSKEYSRVYDALKKQMGKDERSSEAGGGGDEQLQRHPYVAEVLRKKLQEREEDVQRLNVKLRGFLIIEKKMVIQQKSFQDERERYEAELSEWRIKLTKAEERIDRLQRSQSNPGFFRGGSTDGAGDTLAGVEGAGLESTGDSSVLARPRSSVSLRPQSATPDGRRTVQPGVLPSASMGNLSTSSAARPSSSITGRRLPASQTSMGTSNAMSVGELLPQSRRPTSAPRMRPGFT